MARSARSLWTDKLTGKQSARQTRIAVGTPFRGVVLGIDPSLRGTGLALIDYQGQDQARLLESRTLKCARKLSENECLGEISRTVYACLQANRVDHVAVEQTIYVQNFQTARVLGAARGAAVGPASALGLPVHDYPPLSVKQAVVGMGRASKQQVAGMVLGLLGLESVLPADESDAAAVALTHAMTWREEAPPA